MERIERQDEYQSMSAHPRFADTVELDLADMLTTEAQDRREREQLDYLRGWIADAILAAGRL